MEDKLIINGVEYVKKGTIGSTIAMDTWVYCNMCGKGSTFGNGYARYANIHNNIKHPLHVCFNCRDTSNLKA